MLHSKLANFNQVTVSIFELDNTGVVKPNVLFHRPWDKLHSRCIEYPFAASQIGDAQCILDVGTVKSDPVWISWLESLPIQVNATDYDLPFKPFQRINFYQADVRKLPIPDETFDKVLAVSVIEHIGLRSPQVLTEQIPEVDKDGDLEAVKELARVLKTGGELIMTFPFGIKDELILGGVARNYTAETIEKFEDVLKPVKLDYYEYQYKSSTALYEEYPKIQIKNSKGVLQKIAKKINFTINDSYFQRIKRGLANITPNNSVQRDGNLDELPGVVVWRKLPISQTSALQSSHVDGVLCGVWKKV